MSWKNRRVTRVGIGLQEAPAASEVKVKSERLGVVRVERTA